MVRHRYEKGGRGKSPIICREGPIFFLNNIDTECVAGKSVDVGSGVGQWAKILHG